MSYLRRLLLPGGEAPRLLPTEGDAAPKGLPPNTPLPWGMPKALGPALDCPKNEGPLCGCVALKVLAPELAGPPKKESCAGFAAD